MQISFRSMVNTVQYGGWRGLIRPAAAAAALVLSAAVGYRVTAGIVTLLGVGLAGLIAYLVISRHMDWGVLAVVPVTFLVPILIRTGTAVSINSTILMLIVLFVIWLLRMFVLEKHLRLVPSPVNAPVLFFIICVTLSLFIGNLPLVGGGQQSSIPAQIGGWLLYAFSAGSILLVGNNIREVRWLKWFFWIFLALGAVYLMYCWRYGISGANWRFFKEGISGAVFWTMLAAIGFGQALCNRDLAWRWRILAAAVTVVSLAFGWIRGKEWLAGWLPPVIALYIIVWLHDWRLGLLVTIVGGAAGINVFPELYAKINSDTQQWSTLSRFLTWPIMLEMVKINPIFGLGPTNYHQYTPLYPLYGYYVFFNSHNNYWDILAQTGLLGMITFLWLVYRIFRLGFSVLRNAADGFTRSYAITALAVFASSLASGMMADWFMPFLYNIGFAGFRTSVMLWLMLGGLVSIRTIQLNTPAAADTNESLISSGHGTA